jgi:predicted ester cyclase
MSESNKTLVRQYYAAVMGDFAALDQLLSPNFVDHHFPPGLPPGPVGVTTYFKDILGGIFSDMRIEFDFLLAEGDKVDCHFAVFAKHTGKFAEIAPKGNLIRCAAISTFRVEDGKLAEAWEMYDSGDLLTQMKK